MHSSTQNYFSEPTLFHVGWESWSQPFSMLDKNCFMEPTLFLVGDKHLITEPTLFHVGRNHYFTNPTLFHAGCKDHTSSSDPTLFHVGQWDHMPVNDYPLLSHFVMLTVTKIEFINHHSLLWGTTPSLSLKYSNFTLDNILVNTFATCSSVAMYWSFTTPFSTISQIY